jgi:dihydrofolate synthase/folylpolyglutamate synthase
MGMAAALNERGWEISEAAINKGLATARWPGRLEQLEWHGRKLLLDGAHNQPAAAALRKELPDQPRRWLLGIQRHKQGIEIVNTLLGSNDQAWILALPNHQSWSAAELRAGLPHRCGQIEQANNAAEGLAALLAPGATPVIAGSLYLLSALWEQLNENNLIKHVG